MNFSRLRKEQPLAADSGDGKRPVGKIVQPSIFLVKITISCDGTTVIHKVLQKKVFL